MFIRTESCKESLSDGHRTCLFCSFQVNESWIRFDLQNKKGNSQLSLKCLAILCQAFLKPDIKRNEERGTLYEPHPVFAAGSDFTSSNQGAHLHFLSFPAFPCVHSFVPYIPYTHLRLSTHWLRTCKSLYCSKSKSLVASADLCFAFKS